jgi:hypothetical protein
MIPASAIRTQEIEMAKGQMRSTKEKKKPKADKKEKAPSAYSQLYKSNPGSTPMAPIMTPPPVKKDN